MQQRRLYSKPSLLLALIISISYSEVTAFYYGADMSAVGTLDNNGATMPYQYTTGVHMDVFAILKKCNLNIVRERLWNNPSSDGRYCDLEGVLRLASRVKLAGLDLLLDLHYSDTWADPGHQTKPAQWAHLAKADLLLAVYNFTYTAVSALKAQNTLPTVVQVGNEIGGGFLWNTAGQGCDDGGSLRGSCSNNWQTFGDLVKMGIKGVIDAAGQGPRPLIMIHTEQGNGLGEAKDASFIANWFKNLQNQGATFDIIGLSYYPQYGAGNISSVEKLQLVASRNPDKHIVLTETNYPFEGNPGWSGEFPFTERGQEQYLSSLIGAVKKLSNGMGVFWWGTEYYNGGAGANPALFDHNGVALPALLNFNP